VLVEVFTSCKLYMFVRQVDQSIEYCNLQYAWLFHQTDDATILAFINWSLIGLNTDDVFVQVDDCDELSVV